MSENNLSARVSKLRNSLVLKNIIKKEVVKKVEEKIAEVKPALVEKVAEIMPEEINVPVLTEEKKEEVIVVPPKVTINVPPTTIIDVEVSNIVPAGISPVSGATVSLKSLRGDINEKGVTGKDGHVIFKVLKIKLPETFELETFYALGLPQLQRKPVTIPDMDNVILNVEFGVAKKQKVIG